MVDDQDWKILNDKLESIERSIVVIQAWIDTQLQNKYYPSRPVDLTKAVRPYGALGEIPCVFDNMSESERMKPLSISCPCPKCSPYCLSYGSLMDAGTVQVGIKNHKLADCISTTKLEE